MGKKNRIGLQLDGWEHLLKAIERAGGEKALKEAVEDALISSKDAVNDKIEKAMVKSNLPAGGKYSITPHTIDSLRRDSQVDWSGYTGEIKIGFELKDSGLTSIFLMYGTPRHKPPMNKVPGLYEAIYGKKTKKEIQEIQKEVISDYLEKYIFGW
jgi:hypothetical protein|nr:MAG TPA: hypothetical protein [Caudoviricetes sp.]